jgi:branched-chain amino acid aminotransferase
MKYWRNGQFLNESDPAGFNFTMSYSGSIWEGIRCYDLYYHTGKEEDKGLFNVLSMKEHINRLFDGCDYVGIPITHQVEDICEAIEELVSGYAENNLYIRPIIYISDSAEGITDYDGKINFEIFVVPMNIGRFGKNTKTACISSFRRSAPNINMQCKNSANYFVGQMAYKHAQENGYDDAFLLDDRGHITELTVSNIFMKKNGRWYTPPNDGSILPGITRQWVMEQTDAEEKYITRYDLYTADCVITCGTYAEIAWINQIDHIHYDDMESYKDLHAKYVEHIYSNC